MEEAGKINFQDAGDADEGVVIVRYDEKTVAIRVSKDSDGDLEVVVDKRAAKSVLEGSRKRPSESVFLRVHPWLI